MDAVFVRGENVLYMNYTPSGADVAAGEVVIAGGHTGIAHRPIVDGELGALAISGGTYDVMADAAIAVGVDVYWVAASSKVSATAGANKYFGTTVEASAADEDIIEVAHKPGGKTV